MAAADDLEVTVTFGASVRRHGGGILSEPELTEAFERDGLGLSSRLSEGYLLVANEGEKPTAIPDDLSFLIARVCFDAVAAVLEGGHYHLVSSSHLGSMDLFREDELTLIGGGEFEANYFPTEALLVALYECGVRFVELVERLEAVTVHGAGMSVALRERERAALAALIAAGLR